MFLIKTIIMNPGCEECGLLSPQIMLAYTFKKNDLIRSKAFDPIKFSVSCISATTWPLRLMHSYWDLLIDKATVENGFLALAAYYD